MRQNNKDTIQNFQLELENENCEEIYKQDNINNKFHIYNIFLIKYENSFPLTQRRYLSNDNKWITTGIRISCKCKWGLYIPGKGSHNHVLKHFVRNVVTILAKVIREQTNYAIMNWKKTQNKIDSVDDNQKRNTYNAEDT